MMDIRIKRGIIVISGLLIFMMSGIQPALADDFALWLTELRAEAMSRGISVTTLDRAFAGVKPIKRIIELDRNQPEFKKSFDEYMKLIVTQRRIRKGRKLLKKHGALLKEIQGKYGVHPNFLVAIWGMETNFGTNLGKFPVIASLATLAHDTRRSSFFRNELLHALTILEEGHIDVSNMEGSWAGAMGQPQFMPSTFSSYAVDGDNDGRKDIWSSLPDVFASAANYLSSYDWNRSSTWGVEVTVPDSLDSKLAKIKIRKPLSQWQDLGIRLANGGNLPEADNPASLVLPSGMGGPAFLVYENYRAVYRWNPSHLYALAVCRLADRLAEGQH